MVAGEPGSSSAVGRGQTGELSKSGCQIGVLLADRQVSIKLVCLLLSKKGKSKKSTVFPFSAHEKCENLYFSFLLKLSTNGKIFLRGRLMLLLALIFWGFG